MTLFYFSGHSTGHAFSLERLKAWSYY